MTNTRNTMIFDAPAKLNLTLRVLARESNGFHQIESLFCALELCDEVEVERQVDRITVTVADPAVAQHHGAAQLPVAMADNLVHHAATAFFHATGLDGGARITLTKRIPIGAGLGGGSSDAAATLAALNELYARPLASQELLHVAAGIGSDVPFFLCGSPFALAWGRGTRLLPLAPPSQRSVLLVVPGESVSTADAYRALDEMRDSEYTPPAGSLDAAALRDWDRIAAGAINDFEPVIYDRIPELARVREDLERHGARPAMLTGTGSVVFGVFHSDDAAAQAADAIRSDFRNVRVILTRTAAPYNTSDRTLP